jgi:hypothetical protein
MPTIKDVTLALMPVTSTGFPLSVPVGEAISGETLVSATVKANIEFAKDEIGQKFHLAVKLRGKDATGSTDLYTFHFQWKITLHGYPATAYLPYKGITASSRYQTESCGAQIQAKLLDEDVDHFVFKGVGTDGIPIYKWQPDADEITAYVTLKHITFSGLSDQHESLQATILVKDH